MPVELEAGIVLATANARYHHASMALRCLMANLGPLQARAVIEEFTLGDAAADQVERLLSHRPRLLGLSVYIWNVELLTEVVALLKVLAPEVVVVVGGPEVSHDVEGLRIVELADHVVQGEGEVAFRRIAEAVLAGVDPGPKTVAGGLPDLPTLELPYGLYTDEDVAHRTLYVEASRGCPYRCAFCLSALDLQVRHVPLERLLPALQTLIDRGAMHFKFIDRTFNLKLDVSSAILSFFLERAKPGMLFHFELVPDRLPEGLRALVAQFPEGSLQFEVGVQSLDEAVGERIARRQHLGRMEDNFRFLRDHTHAHVHADLIVGLPGETLEGFGTGLNRLHAMGPQEIQVGILKRLRGAPIAASTEAFGMVYSTRPPYEVLRTDALSFPELQRLKRFAFVWDRLVNRGNLGRTVPLLWGDRGPFAPVLAFADALFAAEGQVHAIALDRLSEALSRHLIGQGMDAERVQEAVQADYRAADRRLPAGLRTLVAGDEGPKEREERKDRHRRRQMRHVGG